MLPIMRHYEKDVPCNHCIKHNFRISSLPVPLKYRTVNIMNRIRIRARDTLMTQDIKIEASHNSVLKYLIIYSLANSSRSPLTWGKLL
jgi:hypothetical protein